MAVQRFSGFVYTGAGVAVVGATIDIFARNTLTAQTTVPATVTTDANGYWTATVAAETRCDVRITNGSSISWLKYDDEIQIEGMEVAVLRLRNPADTFDYDIVPAAITADRQLNLPLLTGTATLAAIDEGIKGADIASGATLTLVAGSDFADVTGTMTVTAISTRPAGSRFTFQFDGALTLTHNATTLILQGSTNLTTAAGDVLTFISEGGGNWREESRRLAAAAAGAAVISRLTSNSGTSTTIAAHNMDTVAISGLAAGDMLLVVGTVDQLAQTAAGAFPLYNNTDGVNVGGMASFIGSLAAGATSHGFAYLMQSQQSATVTHGVGANSTVGVNGSETTFTTAWTGAWTLAFRSAGQTSGGTHRWRWSVYRLIAA